MCTLLRLHTATTARADTESLHVDLSMQQPCLLTCAFWLFFSAPLPSIAYAPPAQHVHVHPHRALFYPPLIMRHLHSICNSTADCAGSVFYEGNCFIKTASDVAKGAKPTTLNTTACTPVGASQVLTCLHCSHEHAVISTYSAAQLGLSLQPLDVDCARVGTLLCICC